MQIDKALVDKIANLAKLEFTDEAAAAMTKDLTRIISFVEKLNELNTDNVQPLIYMHNETNVLRKDEVKHEITQKEALFNAPQKDSDYFKVPKVLGE